MCTNQNCFTDNGKKNTRTNKLVLGKRNDMYIYYHALQLFRSCI